MTPGQYTGQQKITPLSKEAHNTGYQAWAKKVCEVKSTVQLFHFRKHYFVRECSMDWLPLVMGLA